MKKIFWIVFIILIMILTIGYSQEIHVGDQHTITWDTVNANGVVEYQVWVRYEGTDILLDIVPAPPYIADISQYGNAIIIGVATVIDGEVSDINWSNVNGESTPSPFILWPVVLPPVNLRIE